MNLAERRPALKVEPDQFPFSDDPEQAARDYAQRHGETVTCPECGSPECGWYGPELR